MCVCQVSLLIVLLWAVWCLSRGIIHLPWVYWDNAKMNLSFKKADWSLFTYFTEQLCLQLKPPLRERGVICEEEQRTLGLALCLNDDLTVTFLPLPCRLWHSIPTVCCTRWHQTGRMLFLCSYMFYFFLQSWIRGILVAWSQLFNYAPFSSVIFGWTARDLHLETFTEIVQHHSHIFCGVVS